MSRYLLDTNVLSELSRPKPRREVISALKRIPAEESFLSEVVIAEIRFGAENVVGHARRKAILDWLNQEIRPAFEGRILSVTEDIFVRWRWIVELSRRRGYTFDQADALVAATAVHHGLVVVTRDMSPFEHAGVACLSPWRT